MIIKHAARLQDATNYNWEVDMWSNAGIEIAAVGAPAFIRQDYYDTSDGEWMVLDESGDMISTHPSLEEAVRALLPLVTEE